MGIGDPGGEELIGGKQRLGAGALEYDRDRSGGTRGLGSGQQGSLGRGTVHGDLGNDKNLYRYSPANRSRTLGSGVLWGGSRGGSTFVGSVEYAFARLSCS